MPCKIFLQTVANSSLQINQNDHDILKHMEVLQGQSHVEQVEHTLYNPLLALYSAILRPGTTRAAISNYTIRDEHG